LAAHSEEFGAQYSDIPTRCRRANFWINDGNEGGEWRERVKCAEGVYLFLQGDAWHLAAELHKLELILNIVTLGYSVVYVDVDTVFFRNPMNHLLSLKVTPSP